MASTHETNVITSIQTLHPLLTALSNPKTATSPTFLAVPPTASDGILSILTLLPPPYTTTHEIDLRALSPFEAFRTPGTSSLTLKSFLASEQYPKIFYDVRRAAAILRHTYDVQLGGIEQDVQLMELASIRGERDSVLGIGECVQQVVEHLPDGLRGGECGHKRDGEGMFGRGDAGVGVVKALYEVFEKKLRPPGMAFWREEVRKETVRRVKGSGLGEEVVVEMRTPWSEWDIETARDAWNEEILERALGIGVDDDEDWTTLDGRRVEEWDPWDYEEEEEDGNDWYDDGDTARDCIGWEEDMIARGSPF